ncbi:MAG: hypothetical protein M1817_005172 [Caeruleum heppii]|nr:MAG: hypothetical protein M1817_005172 [Caeruleum heppii]
MAARGEEELLDDSFDKLEVDTLNQLEHEAFRSTQWKRSGYEETSLLLSDQQLPTWPSTTVQQARIHDQETARISQHHEAAGPVIRQPPSSDYGDLDEDNLLPVGDVETYRDDDKSVPLNPRIKPGLGGQWQLDQNQYSASTGLTPLPRVPQDIVPFSASIVNPQADAVHEAIQIQLRESERERESLRRALEEAQSAALAKTGEVSIIRANLAKTSKEFQRSMVAFEKAQADENARQLAEMEVAEKERQRVVTHNVFLQQELAEGVENFRRLKQSMREAAKQDGQSPSSEAAVDVSPMITPKKPSNLPGRDGFDDGEIIAPASRSLPARSRFGSPKTGNKRKRTSTGGSPGQALPLSQPRTGSSPSVGARHEPMMINEALVAKLQEEHGSFEVSLDLFAATPYSRI